MYPKGRMTMSTVLSADAAEAAVVAAIGATSVNIELRPHDDDPGGSHTDNYSPGIDPVVIEDAEWGAFTTDTSTSATGGRVTASTVELEFKDEATDDGSIAYLTVWVEDDPIGAPGVYDVWKATYALAEPVTYSTGNRVYMPIGDLEAFAAGAS